MKLRHTLQPLNDSEEHLLKIKVGIQGTSTSRFFFQYFQWDWDNYNMMMEGGGDMEFECPPDVPDCNDFKEWEDEHHMDCMCAPEEENCGCDMECPPDMPNCHDCDPNDPNCMPGDRECGPEDPNCNDHGHQDCDPNDP